MTVDSTTMRLRPDLVHRKIWSSGKPIWVVKDPLSRSFFHFSEQEYTMLCLADGNRSLARLYDDSANVFRPMHLWPEQVVLFFADAKSKGLLMTVGAADPNCSDAHNGRRWWHNPLAIRVPGIDPTKVLDAVDPFVRPLFSTFAFVVAGLLMVAAGIIAVTRFGDLAAHIATAASRVENLLVLICVIAVTKVIHEFAHAMACRRFGGQCSEMGLMFLVGVPALYCDVSDAWMIERPWKRMLVSAAGMLAELTLAALATFVWVTTIDGPVRDVCVTVMIVCSVSTLLLNGNPLLRYDGYYLLSDAIGMPNLATRSRLLLAERFKQFLWSIPDATSYETEETLLRRRVLLGYAVASGMYRAFVYALLATMFYFGAESRGLGMLAGVLVVAFAVVIFVRMLMSICAPPSKAMRRSALTPGRPALVSAVVVAATVLGLLIPLPRSVVAPMITGPLGAETIVASRAGTIRDAMLGGEMAKPGGIVARLTDNTTSGQHLSLVARRDLLRVRLENVRDRRGFDRDASRVIPAMGRALDETNKQLEVLQRDIDQLQVHSKGGGVVFKSARIPSMPAGDWDARSWAGTPLDESNRGAHLDAGTEICVIGDAFEREAVLYLRQQDIELIRTGQRVVLRIADRPRGSVAGRVIAVAASPVTKIPESLIQGGWIAPPTIHSEATFYFPVRIRIESQAVPLPVRLIASAQIDVDSASLATRLKRLAGNSFD